MKNVKWTRYCESSLELFSSTGLGGSQACAEETRADTAQTMARNLPQSCQKVAKTSCQKVTRKSWESHKTVMRKSWDSHDSHETVIRHSTTLLQLQTFTDMFVLVSSMKWLLTSWMACLSGKCHGRNSTLRLCFF